MPNRRRAATVDLSEFPLLLRSADLAKILNLHEKTILAATVRGDRARVPAPALLRPYRWRRGDVQAFLDDATEFEQRRALLRGKSA
jgi:hypothetical protein